MPLLRYRFVVVAVVAIAAAAAVAGALPLRQTRNALNDCSLSYFFFYSLIASRISFTRSPINCIHWRNWNVFGHCEMHEIHLFVLHCLHSVINGKLLIVNSKKIQKQQQMHNKQLKNHLEYIYFGPVLTHSFRIFPWTVHRRILLGCLWAHDVCPVELVQTVFACITAFFKWI